MRNTEERMAAVQNRAAELEGESRQRRNRWIAFASVAACLLLIVGLSLRMPEWAGRAAAGDADTGAAASLFAGSGMLGYLVIGILAFLLGVAVTVLCFLLRRQSQDKDDTP